MKKTVLVFALAIIVISTAEKCGSGSDVSPESATAGCFANSPLENISWAKDQLTSWQQPKSGPLQVIIYSYKNEDFLAFENGFDSGPSGHIFDCSGVTLGKRGINYNEFYSNNKKVKVLLQETY